MPSLFFDKDGRSMTVQEWSVCFMDITYCRIMWTKLKRPGQRTGKTVSTIWDGINRRMFGEGAPLVFETMVFSERHDVTVRRTATELDALVMHAELVHCYTMNRAERRAEARKNQRLVY